MWSQAKKARTVVSRTQFADEGTHQDDALDDGVSVVLRIGLSIFHEHVDYNLLLHVSATGVARSPAGGRR